MRKINRDRALALLKYGIAFREALEDAAARAMSSESHLIATTAFHTLYLPKEVVAATEAAKSVGMTVEVGVASLTMPFPSFSDTSARLRMSLVADSCAMLAPWRLLYPETAPIDERAHFQP